MYGTSCELKITRGRDILILFVLYNTTLMNTLIEKYAIFHADLTLRDLRKTKFSKFILTSIRQNRILFYIYQCKTQTFHERRKKLELVLFHNIG